MVFHRNNLLTGSLMWAKQKKNWLMMTGILEQVLSNLKVGYYFDASWFIISWLNLLMKFKSMF